jgi:hypothetical protein
LVRGEGILRRLERTAGAAAFRRQREPRVGLDNVDGGLAALEMGEAEIVLCDGVAALGFRAQRREIVAQVTRGGRRTRRCA